MAISNEEKPPTLHMMQAGVAMSCMDFVGEGVGGMKALAP